MATKEIDSYYIEIGYCIDKKHWYWEDYKNDTYRQGFNSEEEAREDLKGWINSGGKE